MQSIPYQIKLSMHTSHSHHFAIFRLRQQSILIGKSHSRIAATAEFLTLHVLLCMCSYLVNSSAVDTHQLRDETTTFSCFIIHTQCKLQNY